MCGSQFSIMAAAGLLCEDPLFANWHKIPGGGGGDCSSANLMLSQLPAPTKLERLIYSRLSGLPRGSIKIIEPARLEEVIPAAAVL